MKQSLPDALRAIARRPATTALIVGTFAISIGTVTAMFSVVDSLLIRPLPYTNSDTLLELGGRPRHSPQPARLPGLSGDVILALRDSRQLFSAVEAYQFGAVTITGAGEPEIVASSRIKPGLLRMLGAAPRVGRLFNDDEAAPGANVILISERLWSQRFRASDTVVGAALVVDNEPNTIAGVLPNRFGFPETLTDIWRPLAIVPGAAPANQAQVIASLAPGVSNVAAVEQIDALVPHLHELGILTRDRELVADELLQRRMARGYSTALYPMFGAVCLVLLVGCVNAANLLLVGASQRANEFALRVALGATRTAIVGRVLTEAIVLGVIGGLGGLVIAKLALAGIVHIQPGQMAMLARVSPDIHWRVLVFAAGTSLVVCIAASILPAMRASRVDLAETFKRRSAAAAAGRDARWQSALVSAQLALVVVLLAGGGLLTRSFLRLVSVDLGIVTDNVVVAEVQFSDPRYRAAGTTLAFINRLDDMIERGPGGPHATYASGVPPSVNGVAFDVRAEAEGQAPGSGPVLTIPRSSVAPDYFRTLGIPLVEGRTFSRDDGGDVVIVNDVTARRFWGAQSPLGRRFRINSTQPWLTVVGVARDVKSMGLDDTVGEGMELYFPYGRNQQPRAFTFVVRAPGPLATTIQELRSRIRQFDPQLPVTIETMESRVAGSVWRPRFFLRLVLAFALLAVMLAAVGVYATASYWVGQRVRDLAVRSALGATRRQLMSLALGQAVRTGVIGGFMGVAASLAAARTIEAMLFATSPYDAAALSGAAAALGVLVVAASCTPAMRAARADPITILRSE